MENIRLSVTEFVERVNETLDIGVGSAIIVGEVSDFRVNKGKWVRFKLKDDESSVDFFGSVYSLRVPIEDGMLIQVVGQPRLSNLYGFSVSFKAVQPMGEGSIKRAFELLLAKLSAEGLFEQSRKRQLPFAPSRIGLISSTQAAGYVDFLKILESRWGGMEVTVANTLVQGVQAPAQIIRAINYFNEMSQPPEILVIVRGGGSADDLAAFNDEALVRAIAASRIPTLVGVGHEVDTTLSDLAADVRAATPSNAAEIIVPDRREIRASHEYRLKDVLGRIDRRIDDERELASDSLGSMLVSIEDAHEDLYGRLRDLRRTLQGLDPELVLRRGYGLLRNEAGGVLTDVAGLGKGDILGIETDNHNVRTEVLDVSKKRK